jgi:transcriptional regulator with XRE-family HTH domain
MAGNLKFGKRIRELREAKKRTDPAFSLRRFAQALKMSATFISKMETGQFDPPRAENIMRMAELLGADPYELLQLAEKPDPELVEMVKEQPREVADFLRMARERGVTAEQLAGFTQTLQSQKRRKS